MNPPLLKKSVVAEITTDNFEFGEVLTQDLAVYNYEITVSLNQKGKKNTSVRMFEMEALLMDKTVDWFTVYNIQWIFVVREYMKSGWPHWHMFISSNDVIPAKQLAKLHQAYEHNFGRTSLDKVRNVEAYLEYQMKELRLSSGIALKERYDKILRPKGLTGHKDAKTIREHWRFFEKQIIDVEEEEDEEPMSALEIYRFRVANGLNIF